MSSIHSNNTHHHPFALLMSAAQGKLRVEQIVCGGVFYDSYLITSGIHFEEVVGLQKCASNRQIRVKTLCTHKIYMQFNVDLMGLRVSQLNKEDP